MVTQSASSESAARKRVKRVAALRANPLTTRRAADGGPFGRRRFCRRCV